MKRFERELEQVLHLVPFATYDTKSGRYASNTRDDDDLGEKLENGVSFVASLLKSNARSAATTIGEAWTRLDPRQRRDLLRYCGAVAAAREGPCWKTLREELVGVAKARMPRVVASELALCTKRCNLTAFHSWMLRVIGTAKQCNGVPLGLVCTLQGMVDRDVSPFPLSLVTLFSRDRRVNEAIRDYHAYWCGAHESHRRVFTKWNRDFWQSRPREWTLCTVVCHRFARRRGQRLRYVRRRTYEEDDAAAAAAAATRHRCDCPARVRFCRRCLNLLTFPDILHAPKGRGVLLKTDTLEAVCQTCNTARVTSVALWSRRNPHLTMTIGHPDRQPVRVCDGNDGRCINVTSNPDGRCGSCAARRRPKQISYTSAVALERDRRLGEAQTMATLHNAADKEQVVPSEPNPSSSTPPIPPPPPPPPPSSLSAASATTTTTTTVEVKERHVQTTHVFRAPLGRPLKRRLRVPLHCCEKMLPEEAKFSSSGEGRKEDEGEVLLRLREKKKRSRKRKKNQ